MNLDHETAQILFWTGVTILSVPTFFFTRMIMRLALNILISDQLVKVTYIDEDNKKHTAVIKSDSRESISEMLKAHSKDHHDE